MKHFQAKCFSLATLAQNVGPTMPKHAVDIVFSTIIYVLSFDYPIERVL